MYSSESEESDNDTKRINFNEFLYARHHKYKWKDLEFDSYINEQKIFSFWHDSLIDINEQKIFDWWEHDFNINKNAYICDNLDFHYIYNRKCIPFLLKIENCCMMVRKGNHLARIKYLEPFLIGISSSLWQVHSDFVEKK